MKLARYLLFCFILFSTSIVYSQKRYLFHIYNTSNGLPNNFIMAINQDRNGYLWFGSSSGVSRFNGYEFNNNVIPAIDENQAFTETVEKNKDGGIIATGFMQGILVENKDGSFSQYLYSPKKIGKNIAQAIQACPDSSILIGASRYLYRLKNKKFKLLYDFGMDRKAIIKLRLDKKGNIWFGGYYGLGLFIQKDTGYKPVFIHELRDKFIVDFIIDKDENFLVGTSSGYYKLKINQILKDTIEYSIEQPFEILKNKSINHIFIDKQLNVWISTPTHGIYKTFKNNILENISARNGLPTDNVMCYFQDKDGINWFGTSVGVAKLVDFSRYSFTYKGNPIPIIDYILKDKYNRYWFWNGTQLLIIGKNSEIQEIDFKKSPIYEGGLRFISFAKDGNVWMANHNNLFSMPLNENGIDLGKLKVKVDFRKNGATRLRMMTIDKEGKIWLGFENGLFVYENNQFYRCKINSSEEESMRPHRIVQDRYGYYWIGDFNFGLYRMRLAKTKEGKHEFNDVKIFRSLKPDSAFVNAWIQDLLIDNEGYLWQSSLSTGVYKLKLDKNGVVNSTLFSTKNGLSSNNITQIIQDSKNNFWLGTQNGADCMSTSNDKIKINHYNGKNGLGNEVYSIFPDSNIVFISYSEGLYAIDPTKEIIKGHSPLKVIVSNITVMGKTDSSALKGNIPLVYNYNQNFISFEFEVVAFNHENGISYQYMLEGLDRDWSKPSKRRYVNYNSLKPGKYIFKLRAIDENGSISSQETSINIKIKRPFYSTWWFILLIISLIISVIYFVYQYRLKQILKVERLRTRIASDLHDDVGSTLSSISILSEILSGQLDTNPQSAEMINKIGTNARNMLESMDDIIWAVNPSNDKFPNLGLRIREYAIPLFELKNIKFQIHSSDSLELLPLPMNIRRNLYLIVKESVNNLIKYSECTEVLIDFAEKHSYLFITVSDNGKGFDPESPSSRNGLKNMKRRAEQINATIGINSEPGKGTSVRLEIKIG